jgi:hypothetical protein
MPCAPGDEFACALGRMSVCCQGQTGLACIRHQQHTTQASERSSCRQQSSSRTDRRQGLTWLFLFIRSWRSKHQQACLWALPAVGFGVACRWTARPTACPKARNLFCGALSPRSRYALPTKQTKPYDGIVVVGRLSNSFDYSKVKVCVWRTANLNEVLLFRICLSLP